MTDTAPVDPKAHHHWNVTRSPLTAIEQDKTDKTFNRRQKQKTTKSSGPLNSYSHTMRNISEYKQKQRKNTFLYNAVS